MRLTPEGRSGLVAGLVVLTIGAVALMSAGYPKRQGNFSHHTTLIADFEGMAAPALSASGEARLYATAVGQLMLSENGGAYATVATGASIPASTGASQVLIGDGAGGWAAEADVTITAAGAIVWPDGAARTLLDGSALATAGNWIGLDVSGAGFNDGSDYIVYQSATSYIDGGGEAGFARLDAFGSATADPSTAGRASYGGDGIFWEGATDDAGEFSIVVAEASPYMKFTIAPNAASGDRAFAFYENDLAGAAELAYINGIGRFVGNSLDVSSLAEAQRFQSDIQAVGTLGLGVATFAANNNVLTVSADGAGNTVTSITGTNDGAWYYIITGNTGLTIQDGTACACAGDFVSDSANDVLVLVDVGATLVEVSRSNN